MRLCPANSTQIKKCALPGLAAIGGMLFPAILFLWINHDQSAVLKGWAIPTATDIAFSLGVIALLGRRIPVALKVFLMALAIFDDIGAIIIIALFYTQAIDWTMLLLSLPILAVFYAMNRCSVSSLAAYLVVGGLMWVFVLKSGVHATLVGIVMALMVPVRDRQRDKKPILREIERRLHPWVAYFILPVFAFFNAGVKLTALEREDFKHPLTLGIILGLFVGKQLGVLFFSWLGIRCRWAEKPQGVTYTALYGVGLLAGIGFTMSLFIGGLAFGSQAELYLDPVRLGVVLGSLLSGLFGYWVLSQVYPSVPRPPVDTLR